MSDEGLRHESHPPAGGDDLGPEVPILAIQERQFRLKPDAQLAGAHVYECRSRDDRVLPRTNSSIEGRLGLDSLIGAEEPGPSRNCHEPVVRPEHLGAPAEECRLQDIVRIDEEERIPDRKSTRLNSSHVKISYA